VVNVTVMEIEIRICEIELFRRWEWVQFFQEKFLPLHARIGAGKVVGQFLAYRDDATFIWLQAFGGSEERLASRERLWNDAEVQALLATAPPLRSTTVHNYVPAAASTIASPEDFGRIAESKLLELRQYRIAPGMRSRFATFFHEKTLPSQGEHGMAVYGPFESLDDGTTFTWFRGFPDLVERDRRKAAFYGSRLWLEDLQDEAFSMIEDYSNVLLVTPLGAR